MKIISLLSCIAFTICFIIEAIKRKRKWQKEEEFIVLAKQFKPFSIPDYLSRRERTILDLMERREKEEPYIITLWLGLDGLQLNEDGSTEWISRRKVEEKDANSGLTQILQNSLENDIAAMQLRRMQNQLQNLYAYQNMNTQYANLQSMIQTQCQNTILPAYSTCAPLFMTKNTPYWTYFAGGQYCNTR